MPVSLLYSIQISKSCVRILFDHCDSCVTIFFHTNIKIKIIWANYLTIAILVTIFFFISSTTWTAESWWDPWPCFLWHTPLLSNWLFHYRSYLPASQACDGVWQSLFFLKFAFLKYTNAEFSPQTLSFLMLSLTFDVSFGSQQPRARRNIFPPPGTSTTFTERDLLDACTCSVCFIFVNLSFSS